MVIYLTVPGADGVTPATTAAPPHYPTSSILFDRSAIQLVLIRFVGFSPPINIYGSQYRFDALAGGGRRFG